MTEFDATTAIVDFLADQSSTTLELPHMTTGQRKKTKMLLDTYPELRCESFGFGSERRLHLFKKDADVATHQPHITMSTEPSPSKIENCKGSEERDCSPECSTYAATEMSDGIASPQSINQDNETDSVHAVHFVNVRNTFIHMETASMDQRTVQSMPHGMFGKCMLAEISQSSRNHDKPVVEERPESSETHTEDDPVIGVGALVTVHGLIRAPMFNGLTAVVEGWDEASGRYRILIGSTGFNGGSQQAMVKEENLTLVLPCP